MIRIRILQSNSSFGAHDMCFPNEYVRTVATSFTRCAAIDKLPTLEFVLKMRIS